MADDEDPGYLISTISIVRRLDGNDVVDYVSAEDGEGHPLDLATALGMLRLAEDTLIRVRMGDDDDDDA